MINRRFLLSCLAAGVVGAGAVVSSTAMAQPAPYAPIPAPRYEVVPGPRHGYLWEPGHWHWDGVQYVWIGGRYIVARAEYRRYVPGHWRPRGPGWEWVPSHWEY